MANIKYPIGTVFVWDEEPALDSFPFLYKTLPLSFNSNSRSFMSLTIRYYPHGSNNSITYHTGDRDDIVVYGSSEPTPEALESWTTDKHRTMIATAEWSILEECNDFMLANGAFIAPPPSHTLTYKYNSQTLKTQQLTEIPTLPTPTLNIPNATFIGWYNEPDYQTEVEVGSTLTADKTIYAKFMIQQWDKIYIKPKAGIPLADLDNATQQVINDNIKLSAITAPTETDELRLYGKNSLGEINGVIAAQSVVANAVPQRDEQGNVQGNAPVNDGDYATKKYVDENGGGGGLGIYESEVEVPWVFGVEGINGSDPQLTRTDDAIGMTWRYTGTQFGSAIETGFDTIFNFERVTDDDGNEFIRIPKMYRKFDGGDKKQISNDKLDGFECYPIFKNEDDEEVDYFDYACYKGSVSGNKLQSKSGVERANDRTIDGFRTCARNNSATGYRYQQNDIHALMLIWDLFQIVFATRNTEDVIGRSWKKYNGTMHCGDTDVLVNNNLPNPKSICGKKIGLGGFKFFGMEDIVGYGHEFIDGIYFSSSSIYISYVPSQYTDSTSGKVRLSYSRPTSSNYISKLGYDVSNPFINYPVENNGSSTTYYTDYNYYDSSGTVLSQGPYSFYAEDGLFSCYGSYGSSRSAWDSGARLCRRPL